MQDKVYYMSSQMSLVIPNVDYDDAGTYECSAINVNTARPTKREIRLDVECE